MVRRAKHRMEWELHNTGRMHVRCKCRPHCAAAAHTSGIPPLVNTAIAHRDDSSLAPVLPVLRAAAEWSHSCCSTTKLPTPTSRNPTTCNEGTVQCGETLATNSGTP